MPVLSQNLKIHTDPKATKLAWTTDVQQLMGNARRLTAYRDANANAADPVATGTKFLDMASTGPLQITSGNITGFGLLSNCTVRQAANLASGACVLRLEGNGYSITYTLGLDGANKEFTLPQNPDGNPNTGFAFKAGAGMKAPVYLDSGTGPLSPSVTDDMVAAFRLCDWSTGVRVVVGTASLSFREPNLVMDHPWMASEMGDVRIMRTPDGQGVVWGTGGDCYRFAGTLYVANPVVNGQANVPLQQVEIRAVPHGRWASFPFMKDLNIAVDTLIPQAHKIELLNSAGTIVDVIEMYSSRDVNNTPGSGKPVNDPSLSQVYGPTKPLQPLWTCLMTHQWWSHRPKIHSKAFHFNPGVEDEALHPSNVAQYASDPLAWPLINGKDSWNGLGSYKVCPKWSRAQGTGCDTELLDTFYVNIPRDGYVNQGIGYGFEPAANCKHTWYMSPGGSRHDRACWPGIITTWASQPTGQRLHGSVPHTELLHHWMMGYFNHSCHYFTDGEKGHGIPKSKVLNGEICYQDTYYGDHDFRPDMPNNAVRLLSAINQGLNGQIDKNGHRFTNEYSRDYMHSQSNAAVGAYTYVSPAHVMAARHSFTSHIMAAFDLSQGFDKGFFLGREHAWHNWQFANMWMIGNDHPDHFTVQEIEEMWGRHLEHVYDSVYPSYASGTDMYSVCLRNLGMGVTVWDNGDGTSHIDPTTDSKAFYFAQVFLLMKQSGSFAAMHARSVKCAAALDMMLTCLTKFAVGMFIDANGRGDKARYDYPLSPYTFNNTNPVYPNWGDIFPPNGQMDWLRLANGALGDNDNAIDRTNTMHFRAQWLMVMKRFYSEYTFPRLDQAITVMRNFYSVVSDSYAQGGGQFAFRFSMMGLFKAPDQVGPPA